MREASALLWITVVGVILILGAMCIGLVQAQGKASRFPFFTYQFTDNNASDVCVYVFYAGQPPTISLTSVVIPGACNQ